MESTKIRDVVNYQRDRFFSSHHLIKREVLNDKRTLFQSNEIVFIAGVRRSGKSSLLRLIVDKLLYEYKVDDSNINYLNFEDPKLVNFTLEDCDSLYQIFLENSKYNQKKYIFLDEIQRLIGWERWVNNLYEFEKVKIYITGSNSSILNSEISNLLTGRNRLITLLPFSFKEFLLLKRCQFIKRLSLPEVKSKIRKYFNEYIQYGGFPEAAKNSDLEILKSYYNDIIYRDIIGRGLVRKTKELQELGFFLASNPGRLTSSKKLKVFLGLESALTVQNYLQILEDAFIFFKSSLFNFSVKKQIYNPPKVYMVDHGLSEAVAFHSTKDYGWLYENVVFIELKRKGLNTYYWKSKRNKEVDFVVKKGQRISQAIQVSFSISDIDTLKREVDALLDAKKELNPDKLLLITDDEERIIEQNGVKIYIIPLWKWLIT